MALALVSGAALVVEIAAGRLLAPCVGMSLYTWTAIVERSDVCIGVVDDEQEAGRPGRLMVIDHMGHGISDRDEPRRPLAGVPSWWTTTPRSTA